MLGNRPKPSSAARCRHPFGAADYGDPPMAEVDEMPHGQRTASFVVHQQRS